MSEHVARKRFGQHFLHDPAVLRRIVEAIAPAADDTLVEIGPGQGALTGPLLASGARVIAIELDRDLAPRLRQTLSHAGERLTVIEADALQVDFADLAISSGAKLRVCGNLPYNVSTPLLFHLLAHRAHVTDMHFMLQKEVVTRMAAAPGGREYGRLTVMLAAACTVEPLFHVGPGAFRPPPRVDSSVVRLRVPPVPPLSIADHAVFAELVRKAFSMRRKTLRNAVRRLLPDTETIVQAGLDPSARPETLAPADFARLAACIGDGRAVAGADAAAVATAYTRGQGSPGARPAQDDRS